MTQTGIQPPVKVGVVFLNLGGPTSVEAIRPFLFNLFNDPDIIKLGGGRFQRGLANFIAKRRAPKKKPDYEAINACPNGCTGNQHCPNRANKVCSTACSPINPLTERQRCGLEKLLNERHPQVPCKVYTAMRYWKPDTATALADLKADGITHVVLLPLYPQFSYTSTGSSFNEWERKRGPIDEAPWQELVVKNFYQHPQFISAISQRIDDALARFPEEDRSKVHLVFSAHGTPMSEVRNGDPYTHEVRATIEAVMALRGHDRAYWHAFQSRVGPVKWTEPNTEKLVKRLLRYGVKHLVLIPVAFVTDHIETFVELEEELKEEVQDLGFKQMEVTEGLNDHPDFLAALADQVLGALTNVIVASDVQVDTRAIQEAASASPTHPERQEA